MSSKSLVDGVLSFPVATFRRGLDRGIVQHADKNGAWPMDQKDHDFMVQESIQRRGFNDIAEHMEDGEENEGEVKSEEEDSEMESEEKECEEEEIEIEYEGD